MRKTLFFILFMQCISNIYSQEINFIHQFYGYDNKPHLKAFILSNLPTNASSEEIKLAEDYYIQNKAEIISAYDKAIYLPTWREYVNVEKKKSEKFINTISTIIAVAEEVTPQIITNIQQINDIEKQEKAAMETQWRAEQQARAAQNKQKYAEFQAMTNKKVHSSDYQSNTSSYRTQGSYNDLLTSDPDWNKQVQMWVQQYGVEKTREMINQQRTQQRQMEATTGGFGGHIISAVTEYRRTIKIQVRDKQIGGRIVAYSLGGDFAGKQQWRPTDTTISKCTSNLEFQYTSYIQGVGNIYFDM